MPFRKPIRASAAQEHAAAKHAVPAREPFAGAAENPSTATKVIAMAFAAARGM